MTTVYLAEVARHRGTNETLSVHSSAPGAKGAVMRRQGPNGEWVSVDINDPGKDSIYYSTQGDTIGRVRRMEVKL